MMPGLEGGDMHTYKALVVDKANGEVELSLRERSLGELPSGEVTIRVAYSSFNYKDALACIATGRVAQKYPLVPGIDLAGEVVESTEPKFSKGEQVVLTGYGLGVSHDGGFSELARVPADWLVPLPEGLTSKEAMILGTAGFTAGLSLLKMEMNGLSPENGTVLVTGATGGVGSVAVSLLARRGYQVAASTGKMQEAEYLEKLGAREILSREEVSGEAERPMEKGRWAGAVDPVGGMTLAYLTRTMQYGGVIASCGLTGGVKVSTTVYPFILRGVSLLGIDSVMCPRDKRVEVWKLLAEAKHDGGWLEAISNEVTLDAVPGLVEQIMQGKIRGRTVVKVGG